MKKSDKQGGGAKKIVRSAAKIGRSSTSGRFVIGSKSFAKISEVEGIVITREMQVRSRTLDSKGATAAERRATIIKTYRKA